MLLAELAREGSSSWRKLHRELAKFGSASGLFEDIDVLRKGEQESDPFQLSVETGGQSVNLVDVGYGVSQVLPILVDTLRSGPLQWPVLLQQPEVHLHPRAQAELGTFFANRVRKGSNFIIETHSDYLVDRVRMEVREKNLKADEVSILYFERGHRGARIHNLNLDDQGNIVDAPPSYREFFLREERHLLDVE
ncbi:MAG: AAA family ATPase [Bryobacteraceae bacterium]|nr:AAA family ATPase [Bryobacteraceae bacterium]